MKLLVNDAVLMTPQEFDGLLEYSTSLPTGTTPGKAWKARVPPWASKAKAEWRRGVYGLPYPDGHQYHGQIPIGWRRIVIAGREPTFPREVRIAPAPMRGLPADAPPGMDEGDMCLRLDGRGQTCLGVIEYLPDRELGSCGCSTMRMPPCSYCTSTEPECPACGWRIGD